MTRRIKVVSEPTDLVPILRAFDTPVKREVFKRILEDWKTTKAIEEEFGAEGGEALRFFEKVKLVETRWEPVAGGADKAYRSYYTSFQISTQCTIEDIVEILSVASMSPDEFEKIESEIESLLGKEGVVSARVVSEKLHLPIVRLRSLLKRSTKLELKGHLVSRLG